MLPALIWSATLNATPQPTLPQLSAARADVPPVPRLQRVLAWIIAVAAVGLLALPLVMKHGTQDIADAGMHNADAPATGEPAPAPAVPPMAAMSAPSRAPAGAPLAAPLAAPLIAPLTAPLTTPAGPMAWVGPLAPAVPPAPKACHNCGEVVNIRTVRQEGESSGVGAVAGGALGGVLGHQVGAGRGKETMTVLGAIGGVIGGNQVEKQVRARTLYLVDVRMADGSARTISEAAPPPLAIGARVRVEGNTIAMR
jgi:outer membrane lipoprotein SlyB